MANIKIKVWREEEEDEDLWKWTADSDEDGDFDGFLPELTAGSSKREIIEEVIRAFQDETGSEAPKSAFDIRVLGAYGEDEEEEENEEGEEFPEGEEEIDTENTEED